jgi:hypothetical protein
MTAEAPRFLPHEPHEAPGQQPEDPIEAIARDIDPSALDEDTIQGLIDRHPDVKSAMDELERARHTHLTARGREKEAMATAQEVRRQIGDQLLTRLGLKTESPEEKVVRLEEERQKSLMEIKRTLTGHETEDELLAAFKLTDEEGRLTRDSIHCPLFRTETQNAFETYLRFAADYDAMEKAQMEFGIHMKNSAKASAVRREAHNAVAAMVAKDLGMEFNPTAKDLEEEPARRIVTKMRESIIPGSGEKFRYAELLRGQKLAERFGNDNGAMAETRLDPIIHPKKEQ